MSFARKSISVFGTRLSLFVLGMISSVIITRMLGPTYRGILEILTTVPFLLVNVGSLGIGNGNLYFIGQKKYSFEEVVANSFGVVVILGSFLFLISLSSFYIWRDTLFNNVPLHLVVVSFSIIPLLLFQKLIQYAILGKQEIFIRNKIVIFQGVSNFIVVMILVVYFDLSILGVLAATLISYVLTSLLCCIIVSRETKIRIDFDLEMTTKAIKFGIVPFLALVVMNLIFKSDIFFIKYYLSDAELGYYGLSVSLGEKLWMIPEAIGLVLFATVASGKGNDSLAGTLRVCRVTLWLSLIAGLFLYIAIPILLPLLYGEQFLPALKSFRILLPGISLISIYLILHADLTGRGKAIYTLFIFSCGVLVNIILNIWFIPMYGIEGAALSSTITYGVSSIVLAFVFSRKYSISIMDLLVVKREDITDMYHLVLRKKKV